MYVDVDTEVGYDGKNVYIRVSDSHQNCSCIINARICDNDHFMKRLTRP